MSEEQRAQMAFMESALAMVRECLYKGVTDSVFARERKELIMAVSEPAAFLHRDGLKGTAKLYLNILRTVLRDIELQGAVPRSRYRPMYLRKCLQDHMKIKGEIYRDYAKSLTDRSAGKVARALVKKLQVAPGDPAADRLTESLMAARALISGPKPTSTRRNAAADD